VISAVGPPAVTAAARQYDGRENQNAPGHTISELTTLGQSTTLNQ
jgi:hypothetical protein